MNDDAWAVAHREPSRDYAALAAEQISEFVAQEREDAALRVIWQLFTNLTRSAPDARAARCAKSPTRTGSRRYDALIAAISDHALGDGPRPEWIDEPWRTLPDPWDIEPVTGLQLAARRLTPARIAAHGIYLDASELIDR